MPWARLDDTFHSNPKVTGISDKAFRLYVNGIAWCCQHLTDGSIPKHVLMQLCGQIRAQRCHEVATELVRAGLFVQTDSGYDIHDFTDYQFTKSQVQQRRQGGAERQRKFRERTTPEPRNGVTDTFVTRDNPSHPNTTPTELAEKRRISEEVFTAFFEFWTGRKYTDDKRITKSTRGRINAAVTEALEAEITSADVRERGELYQRLWPQAECTPQALLTHWERFDPSSVAANDACTHQWSDGRTAWSTAMRGGVDITRCDQCGIVGGSDSTQGPPKLAAINE